MNHRLPTPYDHAEEEGDNETEEENSQNSVRCARPSNTAYFLRTSKYQFMLPLPAIAS